MFDLTGILKNQCALKKKKNTLVFHIEFWYSVDHVVFPMKIGFAPGEFGFWENQFDKKLHYLLLFLTKKCLTSITF